jgi:chemotaxis protein CheX
MATLTLPPVLDLKAAAPLRSLILAHRGQDLDLDAANVERIGGLCLQVLLSARKTWAADQKTIRIINLFETVQDIMRLTQASAALGMEV